LGSRAPCMSTQQSANSFACHRSEGCHALLPSTPVSPLFSASAFCSPQFRPSVNPLFATLPRRVPLSPFLATDPKNRGVSPLPRQPIQSPPLIANPYASTLSPRGFTRLR